MRRQHPNPRMEFPISLEIYNQLNSASFDTGLEKEIWEIGEMAIREWMARHNPDSFSMPATSGYQWKHLFLPNGTLLRTVFNSKNFHCLVEDDRIRFNGQESSPSKFVNTVGGVRRNAWKVTWVLFPGTTTWENAATLRQNKLQRRQGERR
jgi:hypothetical protein